MEGPPPLMMARQAARGLDPAQEHDRLHSGELTSTSVGIFELIDKSVRDSCIRSRLLSGVCTCPAPLCHAAFGCICCKRHKLNKSSATQSARSLKSHKNSQCATFESSTAHSTSSPCCSHSMDMYTAAWQRSLHMLKTQTLACPTPCSIMIGPSIQACLVQQVVLQGMCWCW